MTENELLEGSSVAEIRGLATRALAGGDDYSRELLREQLGDEEQRARSPQTSVFHADSPTRKPKRL